MNSQQEFGAPQSDAQLPAALVDVDAADLLRLHARLESRARSEGILDVSYRSLDTPAGTLLLAATPQGLLRVAFESEGHEVVLEQIAAKVSPRILRSPKQLDAVAREIDEYFAAQRKDFDVPLDLRLSSGFRREVLSHLGEIAYGHTASYSAVAALAGRPRAVRAVGTACATNPLPIVVPCHRVLRSDGSLGGYAGGLAIKRTLLALESDLAKGG